MFNFFRRQPRVFKIILGLMAVQYLFAAIGTVSIGLEYFEYNTIKNFPTGISFRNTVRAFEKRGVLQNSTTEMVLSTNTTTVVGTTTVPATSLTSSMTSPMTSSMTSSLTTNLTTTTTTANGTLVSATTVPTAGSSTTTPKPTTTEMFEDRRWRVPTVRGCKDEPDKGLDGLFLECDDDTRDRTLTIFLLAFFVGGLGVARCVAGFWCCGIAQLLTCGGCGVWWLIDWIVVLTLTWQASYNGCCFADNMSL